MRMENSLREIMEFRDLGLTVSEIASEYLGYKHSVGALVNEAYNPGRDGQWQFAYDPELFDRDFSLYGLKLEAEDITQIITGTRAVKKYLNRMPNLHYQNLNPERWKRNAAGINVPRNNPNHIIYSHTKNKVEKRINQDKQRKNHAKNLLLPVAADFVRKVDSEVPIETAYLKGSLVNKKSHFLYYDDFYVSDVNVDFYSPTYIENFQHKIYPLVREIEEEKKVHIKPRITNKMTEQPRFSIPLILNKEVMRV